MVSSNIFCITNNPKDFWFLENVICGLCHHGRGIKDEGGFTGVINRLGFSILHHTLPSPIQTYKPPPPFPSNNHPAHSCIVIHNIQYLLFQKRQSCSLSPSLPVSNSFVDYTGKFATI